MVDAAYRLRVCIRSEGYPVPVFEGMKHRRRAGGGEVLSIDASLDQGGRGQKEQTPGDQPFVRSRSI